ncbi:unnamed protein product [Nezara viridula]|uniref:Uncharacterized protein n=1 Tax=Nezara viridula TaxID=85310 RepID=A0A9P0MVA2_NEZVI|nr:unnamed protein product [Nezara viridula]
MCGCKMPLSSSNLNILDLCRLCLGKDNNLIPVLNNNVIGNQLCDKISVCLTVEIKNEDEVSQKICNHCLTKVDSFFEFRNSTLECQKVLQRWASGEKQKTIESENAALNSKDISKGIKEKDNTELNKTNECDKSEVENNSRGHSDSRYDEENVTQELIRFYKSLASEGQTPASVISREREVPGPSGIQECNKKSPPELSGNEEWPDGKKIVPNKALSTCEFCGQSFTKFKLELHRRKHTGERPFKCSEPGCDWSFASKGMLSSHSKVHSSDRPYACDYCSSSFKAAIHLSNHIKIHTGEKPYYCDLCDYSCIYKATLLTHRKRHLKHYSVICEICGKGFYSVSDLKEHVSGHTGETPFSCSECDQKFSNKYHLRKHKTIVHNTTLNSPVPVQCEKCSRICSDKRAYKNHVRRVHTNKKFECDICGKLIGDKSCLAEHLRIHSGEKPYVCRLCGKCFSGRKSMKLHEVVHTGEKKYECDECGKKFTQKSSLNAHKKLHISNS